ncbi:MAG: DUF5926 family protein [Nocardioides sp.]
MATRSRKSSARRSAHGSTRSSTRSPARGSGPATAGDSAPASGNAVGPRQPCPCGSGRRYKACHGGKAGAAPAFVARPFAGMTSECDVIAMRELVPSATAPLRLRDSEGHDSGRVVRLCSILPAAAPAMVRDSGEIWLGLQVQHDFGDPARDLGAVLMKAVHAEPGVVGLLSSPGAGPRLQDLVEDQPLEITVHAGFDFWLEDTDQDAEAKAAALERANESAHPTTRLSTVEAAYWTDVGTKEHLRWVMPEPEDRLLDALARLHAADGTRITDGSRLVGMFRAHGVLAPVWDLPLGTGAEVLERPAADFGSRLARALDDDTPLDAAQRSARSGLATRQVTIRSHN